MACDLETGPPVTYREALRVWVRIALQSFGGPAGQIAVMHRIVVEEKRWLSEERFLHALNYCMLLPGPEAQQLATYIGWLLHGFRGGLTAGLLFILPGFVSILILSLLYVASQDLAPIAGLFFGLKTAVLAVVVGALVKIGRRVLKNRLLFGIAGAAFVAIFLFQVAFPWIVVFAALLGFAGHGLAPGLLSVMNETRRPGDELPTPQDRITRQPPHTRPSARRALGVVLICGSLWLTPIALFWIFRERAGVFLEEAVFFSKAAVVTFGGAYAVLAYLAQAAVETYGWLQPGEMLDGLGLAETTPGPLIQVVQFVGFLGAYREPGPLSPVAAGVLGSLVTTWVTFVPCFLWVFLGAPFIEALRGRRELTAALTTVTAAVVGVILNLAVWFAAHVIFREVETLHWSAVHVLVPRMSALDVPALLLTAAALIATFRFRLAMLPLLGIWAGLGAAVHLSLG